jgi:glycosyltransferase involved in cell wall biosynthesis
LRNCHEAEFALKFLFVHQNFPGQYKHIAAALARDPRHEVVALAVNKRPVPPRLRAVYYGFKQAPSKAHPLAAEFEHRVIWGEAAALAAENLKKEGFCPDIMIGHPGWGELLFLPDVWPEARLLSFMEFYYAKETDLWFDRNSPVTDPAEYRKLRARNAPLLMTIEASDWSVSPTRWQWERLPDFAQARTSIIHEGIDTQTIRPDTNASILLGRASSPCRPGDEVITFVNRNLEPYRGFHMFIRALPEILRRRPHARAVIVGGSEVSYGRRAPNGQSWRATLVREVADQLDFSRVHFVGKIPYSVFLQLLRVSAAHVYLSYPFVLSWSMLEAMASECLVIGSRTEPVMEVLEHERNGLLVDFFSPAEIAATVIRALEDPHKYRELRHAARETIIQRYDLRQCLPRHLELISTVATGRAPIPPLTNSAETQDLVGRFREVNRDLSLQAPLDSSARLG